MEHVWTIRLFNGLFDHDISLSWIVKVSPKNNGMVKHPKNVVINRIQHDKQTWLNWKLLTLEDSDIWTEAAYRGSFGE